MKHLFIVNPVSGGRKNRKDEVIREIEALMSSSPWEYEVYITAAPGDAISKVRRETEKGKELRIYACGGDGTLNECVNGAAGFPNAAVTHYPCGTGNDFIRTFGADGELFKSLENLLTGEACPVDIIDCNGRYSVNICSVGVDARIGADVHKYSRIPVIGGAAGYIVSLVINFVRGISQPMTVKLGGETIKGEFAVACACNGRYYGGGFNPVPDAEVDDGVIEFLVVPKISRLSFLRMIGKYAKGKYKQLSHIIRHVSGERMEIESDRDIVVNIDGEIIHARKIFFQMVPGGVNMVFPVKAQFFEKCKMKIEANERKVKI